MRSRRFPLWFALPCALSLGAAATPCRSVLPQRLQIREPDARSAGSRAALPVIFEPNLGQTDRRVRFLSRGLGSTAFFTQQGVTLQLSAPSARSATIGPKTRVTRNMEKPRQPAARAGIMMRFLNSNPAAPVVAESPLGGRSHYFLGRSPAGWARDVPQFAQIRYRELYAGIDLVYHTAATSPLETTTRLEHDFVVQPNANPGGIALAIDGARTARVDADGDLRLTTSAGTVTQHRAVAYQTIDGRRALVPVRYRLTIGDSGTRAPLRLAFDLGSYDRSRALVIDPVISYSTYAGGALEDIASAIAVDNSGAVYLTGQTTSVDFPGTATGFQHQQGGGSYDAFVIKLNPAGNAIVYSTYLGGAGEDIAEGIAVDSAGQAVIVGNTNSANFPVSHAIQDTFGGSNSDADAFLTRLTADGASLVFSTYLGGSADDRGFGVALGTDGSVYAAGLTNSTNFPVTQGAYDTTFGGYIDAWAAHLNVDGSALLYATYVGGSGDDRAFGIAVGPDGSAYLVGNTSSTNWPTVAPLQATLHGPRDLFVARLNPAGSALLYSTYLGGSGVENGAAIAVDGSGNAYVAGETRSTDFPTVNPVQRSFGGTADVFVSKLNASGSSLVYSTYLGGSGDDHANRIAVDSVGQAYITGYTNSTRFPTASPTQSQLGDSAGASPGGDAFIAKLSASGSTLGFSTYLGGSGVDIGFGIAVDAGANIYVAGLTASTNFPTASPLQAAFAGGASDAFVVRIAPDAPSVPTALTATVVSASRVDLSWSFTGDPSTIEVQRATGSGAFSAIGSVPSSSHSYSDATVSDSTAYRYQIRAVNGTGASAFAGPASVTTPPKPPSAPSNLQITVLSQTGLQLTWTDNSGNEDGFEIQRAVGNGAFQSLITVGVNTTSYSDSGLTANTTYRYQVRAINAGGDSTFAGPTSATTLPNAPAAPSGLVVSVVSQTSLGLTWSDNSSDEQSFLVERAPDGTTFQQVAELDPNTTTFTDTGLTAAHTYTYRVRAHNTGGNSAYSQTASGTTLPDPPAAPSGLVVSSPTQTSLTLNWQDGSTTEDGFTIERKSGSGSFTVVGTTAANVTTFADTRLNPNTTYTYQVRATNAGGDSAPCPSADGTTLPNPSGAPLGLTVTTLSRSSLRIDWIDGGGVDETMFKVERATDGSNFTQIATVPVGTTTLTDTQLTSNTTYTYRVRETNPGGDSPYSDPASGTTLADPPADPTNLAALPVGSKSILLQWKDNASNETSYQVERKSSGSYAVVTTLPTNSSSFTDTGLTAATSYTYRVRAFNGNIPSGYSNEASTTIPTGGVLRLSPSRLSFGTVRLGKSKTKRMRIQNRGRGTLVGFVGTLPAPFQVVTGSGPFTLAPKASFYVTVKLAPTAAGSLTGTLTVTSSDPLHDPVAVSVLGKAR